MFGKKVEKGYVLLCEILCSIGKVGIVWVVVCICEYLCVVMLYVDVLVLMILCYL